MMIDGRIASAGQEWSQWLLIGSTGEPFRELGINLLYLDLSGVYIDVILLCGEHILVHNIHVTK